MNTNYEKLLKPNNELLYYFPTHDNDKVLIIAPHPDDEVLGCGGIIKKFLSSSISVEILLLTDGSGVARKKVSSQTRKKEFYIALSSLGNVSSVCLELPDGKLERYFAKLVDIMEIYLKNKKPNIIFIPYILDYNDDHRVSNYALFEVVKKNKFSNLYIAMYEIWTPILYPNYYINITQEFETKKKAIDAYLSQEKYYHLLDKTSALNIYRSKLSMRRNVEYTECFKGFSVEDYINVINCYKKILN